MLPSDAKTKTSVLVDPHALELLAQVQRRMQAIRSLSAVCTHTVQRYGGVSPTQTEIYVRTSQARLMRPNYTRIDTALISRKQGEKIWERLPNWRTEASDGQHFWNFYHSDPGFNTGKASADGHGMSLYNLTPLDGFFDPDEFVTSRIDLLQQEGLLRSLTLARPESSAGSSSRLVRLIYQRAGSEVLETEEYTIGADLLIHRIHNAVSSSEVEHTMTLSQIRIDAPMTKASFAFRPPAGMQPRSITPEAPAAPLFAKGAEAPDFTVQDAQGHPIKLSDLRGKWVVLDFWATWCGPCMQSLPGLNTFAGEKKDKNVVVLAISVGDTTPVFQAWMSKHKEYDAIHFAIDSAGINGKGIDSQLYHVPGLPTHFVIDPNGKIQASSVGFNNAADSARELAEAIP